MYKKKKKKLNNGLYPLLVAHWFRKTMFQKCQWLCSSLGLSLFSKLSYIRFTYKWYLNNLLCPPSIVIVVSPYIEEVWKKCIMKSSMIKKNQKFNTGETENFKFGWKSPPFKFSYVKNFRLLNYVRFFFFN